MQPADEDRIRARAHQIWEETGRPDGRAAEHWEMAVNEIAIDEQRTARVHLAAPGQFTDQASAVKPVVIANEAIQGPTANPHTGERPGCDRSSPKDSKSSYVNADVFSTDKTYSV